MDGFEVCRRLKADPATSHIPVVMITALDQVSDRVRGLEAGADDFLTKPVNDLQLMTRVKSLVRLKSLTDEFGCAPRPRATSASRSCSAAASPTTARPPHVLLIDERESSARAHPEDAAQTVDLDVASDPHAGFFQAAETPYECVMVSSGFAEPRSAPAVLAAALARSHPLHADHPDRRRRRGCARHPRPGARHQRLCGAPRSTSRS